MKAMSYLSKESHVCNSIKLIKNFFIIFILHISMHYLYLLRNDKDLNKKFCDKNVSSSNKAISAKAMLGDLKKTYPLWKNDSLALQ